MNLGKDRNLALMGAALALLLVILAVGQDIPPWGRWVSLGIGLIIVMLMVVSSGTARLELLESKLALKRTRNQRDEIKRYFRALMDSMPSWIYFKDRDSNFLQVNKALADYFGKSPRDMVGKSDAAFLEPESAEKNLQDEIQILASGKGRERFIEKENLPGGGDSWVLTSKLPLRDNLGKIIGTFGISSNVTEMVKAKNSLEKERNTLRTLLNSLPDGIYMRNLNGEYIIANQALADFVGLESPEELVGKTPHDFFSKEKAITYVKEDEQVLGTGKAIISRPDTIRNFQGVYRDIVTTKVPVIGKGGTIYGTLGINRDITEQTQAREALLQTELKIQEIMDNSPSPIYAKSVNGKYLLVNRRFQELFDVSSENVVGKTDRDIIEDREKIQTLQEKDQLVIEHGKPVQFDETIQTPHGVRAYVSTKFPMRNLAGDIYAVGGISTDITDHKQAELALKNLNQELVHAHKNLTSAHEQLIQAEKMESVGRLAAGVAHEVKNPLAMIGMGLELLTRRLPEGDTKGQETIGRMKRGIERAKKIVRGLVDYSSNSKLEFQSHAPNELVSDALELVDYQFRKSGIDIDFIPGKNLPKVDADHTKIEQVLVNLFINAMHSMERGGTLTIRTDCVSLTNVEHDEGSRLSERLRTGDELVRIQVTDTGAGIPEEVLSKLFDPFFTTKSTGKGTGLGLTVSRKIAELHGGELTLTNQEDSSGAIATLTLRTQTS